MTYKIWEDNFEKFDKKMQRIIKKSAKYPECNIKYEIVGDVYEEREHQDLQVVYKEILHFIEVDVEGTVINNGWRFIATLEHIPEADRNVIRQADTSVTIPEKFYTCKPECEHCHQNRHRKDTYIVYNEETKEFKQVGKTCLMEYTNGLSAEAVASLNEAVKFAEESDRTWNWKSGDHTFYGDLEKVLEYEEPLVKMQGYIPTKDANGEYNNPNTRSEVYELYSYYYYGRGYGLDNKNKVVEDLVAKGYDPDKTDKQYVQDALNWIKNTDATNTYINNLKAVCSQKYIDMHKDLGLVVSLLSAYYKELQRREQIEVEKKQKKHSKFAGEIGKKISFDVETTRCLTSYETRYGTQYMYQFTDKNNNIYIWRTSCCLENIDNIIKIEGTVKAHNEYKGTKQTELTRCKITNAPKKEHVLTEEEIKAQEELDKAFAMFFNED